MLLLFHSHRHRPLLGECVAAFASTFPVAFLEPRFNKQNKNSVAYGIQGDLGEHSLEARGKQRPSGAIEGSRVALDPKNGCLTAPGIWVTGCSFKGEAWDTFAPLLPSCQHA